MNIKNSNSKTMTINYLNFMKTTKFFIRAIFCLTLITSFSSCSSDDNNPKEVLEEELITNVTLTFTNDADAKDIVILASVAPDGQDGSSTETITGSFTANATYSLGLALTNASENPADDVLNDDIIKEADEHFFTYAVSDINLTMTRDSNDLDGAEDSKLGVNTTWVASAASTGNIKIILTHKPTATDDANEWGSATGGTEDLNITFTGVTIQ